MVCCCPNFMEQCCRRIGCSCRDNSSIGRMATIEKNRSCTDIPCICLFGVFIGVMVFYVWIMAFTEGDPDRLIRGVNHAGLICGKTSEVKHLPYAYWPDLSALTDPDMDAVKFRFKACTADCNTATTDVAGNHIELPIDTGLPIDLGYESVVSLKRYCRPDTVVLKELIDDAQKKMKSAEDAGRVYGDLKTAIPLFGYTFLAATVISFAFILLMKCCVGILVWTVILLIIVCGYGIGVILYLWSEEENITDNEQKIRFWFGVGFFIGTSIFFVMVIFARNRIRIAIEVIKSASRSLMDMPMIVTFPVPIIMVFVGFFFAWAFASVYIVSAGEIATLETPTDYVGKYFASEVSAECADAALNLEATTANPPECADYIHLRIGTEFDVIDYDETIKNSFAPHFFLLLWVTQIFVYFTFMVIAGAVADWYFTPRDDDGDKKRGTGEHELSNHPVLASLWRVIRYHLGSVFYAAAIIATIQFIRACVNYMERQLSPGDKEPNRIQRVLFRVLDCLLWCLECCLDKVNRNALVWVSIYGDAFCPAVCGSFMLIFSNLFRVAVITFFSGLVTLMGKILIPMLTTGLMALVAMNVNPFKDELSSPIVPLVIIFFIAYGVGLLFMTVYDTAIDTVFMCFLIDEKHNKNEGQMLADPDLREIIQKYEEDSKKLAEKHQRRKGQDENGGGDKYKSDDKSNKGSIELQV
jgi:choline transporter-like protein 2/4/5